jgi:hypothetical protein
MGIFSVMRKEPVARVNAIHILLLKETLSFVAAGSVLFA